MGIDGIGFQYMVLRMGAKELSPFHITLEQLRVPYAHDSLDMFSHSLQPAFFGVQSFSNKKTGQDWNIGSQGVL
jgi:hypothetical protein